MSEYPKITERPYKVFSGEYEYLEDYDGLRVNTGVSWAYRRSFWTPEEADAYVENASSLYELMKVEHKEVTRE